MPHSHISFLTNVFTKLKSITHTQAICLIAIFLVYFIFRLGWPETIEFGYDQPKYATQVQRFIDHGTFLTSHEFNDITPFGNFSWSSALIFLLTPFFLVSSDPITVSQLIAIYNAISIAVVIYLGWRYFSAAVGLVAGFFFTVQPWWVIFSRMIYSPGLGPTLVVLCMLATFAVVKQPRTWLLGIALATWGILAQIYINHFSVIFVSFFSCLVAVRKSLNIYSLLTGIVFILILFIPPVYYYQRHPEMFAAYFQTNQQFKQTKQSLPQRISEVTSQYVSVLSGGSFEYQLGTAFDSFNNTIGALQHIATVTKTIVIAVLLYSFGAPVLFWRTNGKYRLLLLLFATSPLWFLTLVQIPGIAPRYFLLCMPAFSLLVGLSIADLTSYLPKARLRPYLVLVSLVLFSLFIPYMVLYYQFIASYSYPTGFISYVSDPPAKFTKQALVWILEDAQKKQYSHVVVSSDSQSPHEYALLNAPAYYWQYVFKKSAIPSDDPTTSYYLLYYSPVHQEDTAKQFHRYGPYVVLDNTQ